MDNLRTAIGHLYGIHVVQALNLLGVGEDFGVGVEYAVDILPYAHRLGIQHVGNDGGRVVRALAAECCCGAIGSATDEALAYEYARGAISNLAL